MAAFNGRSSKWITVCISLSLLTLTASTSISAYFWRKKSKKLLKKLEELQTSLKLASDKCAAERQGRIRAQHALRKALAQPKSDKLEMTSYPMAPIATVQSCFSTRNGTPRQPLIVPLARASLVFDSARAPLASLEGLKEYSHCWILYVFHLNTDLEKLWKPPSQSKLKAKVRVPRLKGARMGLFATRSPHRPCPIGLTVAKVEEVHGTTVLLSGVDLVDGTPVLDVKPYLPYCDSIEGATVPNWVEVDKLLAVASVSFSEGFSAALAECWTTVEKKSLYASLYEFKCLIKQVLSWDIRSVSQRTRPHNIRNKAEDDKLSHNALDMDDNQDHEASDQEKDSLSSDDVTYHLILEGLDISYKIDCHGNVLVEKVTLSSHVREGNKTTTLS